MCDIDAMKALFAAYNSDGEGDEGDLEGDVEVDSESEKDLSMAEFPMVSDGEGDFRNDDAESDVSLADGVHVGRRVH